MFVPTDITGCQLWLDASEGVTYDVDNNVSVWTDESGNSNNATQLVGANQPLLVPGVINGKPVIHFDGSHSFLTGTQITDINTSSFSLFVVFRAANSANYGDIEQIFNIDDFDPGFALLRRTYGSPDDRLQLSNNGNYGFYTADDSIPPTGTIPLLFSFIKTYNVSASWFINSVLDNSTTNAGFCG